jgi:hypothetical protein
MLEQMSFSGRELLVAVALATVIYLLEVLLFSRHARPRKDQGLQRRVETLEDELASLKARMEQLETQPPAGTALDVQSSIHGEAVRMAREGASAQEMANSLGISRGEAELIIALHESVTG